MQYDFDTPIDRTHTWSIKHDFKKENGKADDILPLWVADMDFTVSSYIQDAIVKQAGRLPPCLMPVFRVRR